MKMPFLSIILRLLLKACPSILPVQPGQEILSYLVPLDVHAPMVNIPHVHCLVPSPDSISLLDTRSMPTPEEVLPVNESTVPIAPTKHC